MGLTGEAKKQYQREYMQAKRSNSGSNKEDGSNKAKVAGSNTEYPAIVEALCDPIKRNRLERINRELQAKGLGAGVTYGYGGPDFNQVDDMLRATA